MVSTAIRKATVSIDNLSAQLVLHVGAVGSHNEIMIFEICKLRP
jgi:hypothetical protein